MLPSGTLEQRKLKVRNVDANTVTVADLKVSYPCNIFQKFFVQSALHDIKTLLSPFFLATLLETRTTDLGALRHEYVRLVSGLSHPDLCQSDRSCASY